MPRLRARSTPWPESRREALDCRGDGEADVALYLESELLERLERTIRTPWTATISPISGRRSKASATSRITRGMPRAQVVSLFELELPGRGRQVRDYGCAAREQTGREPRALHAWLFDAPTHRRAELDDDERETLSARQPLRGEVLLELSPGSPVQRRSGATAAFLRLSQTFKLAHIDAG